MAITISKFPNDFALALNKEGYELRSDNPARSLVISIMFWIESTSGSGLFEFVMLKDIKPDNNNSVEFMIESLKSKLSAVIPDLNAIEGTKLEAVSKQFFISTAEITDDQNVLISENYVESDNSYETVDLENETENGEKYLVIIESETAPFAGVMQFKKSSSGEFRFITFSKDLGFEQWAIVSTGNNYNQIIIPSYVKVSVYKNPPTYIDQPKKWITLGGNQKNLQAIA